MLYFCSNLANGISYLLLNSFATTLTTLFNASTGISYRSQHISSNKLSYLQGRGAMWMRLWTLKQAQVTAQSLYWFASKFFQFSLHLSVEKCKKFIYPTIHSSEIDVFVLYYFQSVVLVDRSTELAMNRSYSANVSSFSYIFQLSGKICTRNMGDCPRYFLQV